MSMIERVESTFFQRAQQILLLIVLPIILAFMIHSKSFLLLLGLIVFALFVGGLYLKSFEVLIVLILAINEEFFYLVPKEPLGRISFQALLYPILLVVGCLGLFIKRKRRDLSFKPYVIGLFLLTLMGVLNSFFHGQPLGLSLKAGLGYYLILFYFIFGSKGIDQRKLFNLMIITGIVLTVLNNIQYAFFGSLKIFYYTREMIRIGQLRFLLPEMFLVFTAVIAFGAFLTYQKKRYLLAFLYIVSTIILQGQTRVHIWGLFVACFGLLVLSRRLTFLKAFSLGIPVLVLLVWALPLMRNTMVGRLFELTTSELSSERGNIAVRMDTYDYYFRETLRSPLIGRGIWNDQFDIYMGDNPEDMKYKNLHLGDVGMMSLAFHLGLLGVFWLIGLLAKVAKLIARSLKGPEPGLLYGSAGYFLFSVAAMLTLNCLTRVDSIIYLALVLALISQNTGTVAPEGSARI